MTSTPATYVYGVIASTARAPSAKGIGGAAVRSIPAGELAAVASDIDPGSLQLGRDAMTAHAKVLEDAVALTTVLPMRFGVVMADEDTVRRDLLEAHGPELRAQLDELAGKAELRLRATYDEEQLMREAAAQDPEILRLRDSLRGVPEDATYYGRIQLGELVAAAVQRTRQADAEAILRELTPLAVAVEAGDSGLERVALNASFLVERDRIPQFDERVDQIGRAQAGRLRFKYTGPLPPHSFVHMATAEA
jgi:hypothetical protein